LAVNLLRPTNVMYWAVQHMINSKGGRIVNALLEGVAAFHLDTSVLKFLNPPLVILQLHRIDLMDEGSISEFTLWMGSQAIRWRAIHSDVSFNGFTDTQQDGPLASWRHTCRFEMVDEHTTQIHDHIDYAHLPGWPGLLTRILFGHLGLRALFAYRK
jgi:ligand-binding SRPBCC domain-containing protein